MRRRRRRWTNENTGWDDNSRTTEDRGVQTRRRFVPYFQYDGLFAGDAQWPPQWDEPVSDTLCPPYTQGLDVFWGIGDDHPKDQVFVW